jgi:hypothetical protein
VASCRQKGWVWFSVEFLSYMIHVLFVDASSELFIRSTKIIVFPTFLLSIHMYLLIAFPTLAYNCLLWQLSREIENSPW